MSHEHGGGGGDVLDSGFKDGLGRVFAFLSLIPHLIYAVTSDNEKDRTISRLHAATGDSGVVHH
jgi:hypothetical protein